MYKRVFEQVSVSVLSAVIAITSVFVIVESASKEDYGKFVAELAVQYVIARVLLSGLLVEMQLKLATAANTDWSISTKLIAYVIAFLSSLILSFLSLWQIGLINEPMLGILIGMAMVVSIASFSLKSWLWYRSSVVIPEMILLWLLFSARSKLDLESLHHIYQLYYFAQGVLAAIGVISMVSRIKFTRENTIRFSEMVAGGLASLSIMGRDRLAIAAAGYLYPSTVVAELAYLMTVLKGAMSISATLNSIKFIYVAGIKNSINAGMKALLAENVALAVLTILGYSALWYYTKFYGNSDYLGAITIYEIGIMVVVVLFSFNHSIWYSNLVMRRELWIYNKSAILFLVAFVILFAIMRIVPFSQITLFYGAVQFLLVSSGFFYWYLQNLAKS
jgi:hypothetical protein